MTAPRLIALAAGGSAALLAAAFAFQWLGWAPCKMCLWQRWPHLAAIVLGGAALASGRGLALWSGLGALAALGTGAIGAFHSGVELKWWPGPASCSGGAGLGDLSGAALLPGAAPLDPVVMCDDLVPFFLGLTMANWNMLASALLALIWALAARQALTR